MSNDASGGDGAMVRGERGATRARSMLALAALSLVLATAAVSGCGGDEEVVDAADTGDVSGATLVTVGGVIDADTTWEQGQVYVLSGVVHVTGGATLTIRPGVEVRGQGSAALVINRDARLIANGTRNAPIVFTSNRPVGQRLPGDWGGVALLGEGQTNLGENLRVEGLVAQEDPESTLGTYGGSDDAHNCGSLRYVRVEFAGFQLAENQELNALTVAGCGDATTLEHIQVHRGSDDGVEFFGGTARVKRLLITQPGDDGLDWDQGWRGAAQFVAVQMGAEGGENGVEADNLLGDTGALPRSAPTVYNYTLVGARDQGSHRGMQLRRGTGGRLLNGIAQGFSQGLLNVGGSDTAGQFVGGSLVLEHLIAFESTAAGGAWFPEAEGDDDGGFDEAGFFGAPDYNIRLGVDPQLVDPYDLSSPDLRPQAGSPAAAAGAELPQDTFFERADYLGAFAPAPEEPWTEGWTATPAD